MNKTLREYLKRIEEKSKEVMGKNRVNELRATFVGKWVTLNRKYFHVYHDITFMCVSVHCSGKSLIGYAFSDPTHKLIELKAKHMKLCTDVEVAELVSNAIEDRPTTIRQAQGIYSDIVAYSGYAPVFIDESRIFTSVK